MRSRFLPFIVLAIAPAASEAQTEDETAVLTAVQQFFDAMESHDTASLAEVLIPDGRFFSVRDGEDASVRKQTHEEFTQVISGSEVGFLERMWNPTVLIHGRIAMVWTEYDFHLNGTFSHCGVDAFSLVKDDGSWKIAGIIYTAEPTGCAPSPLGPPDE